MVELPGRCPVLIPVVLDDHPPLSGRPGQRDRGTSPSYRKLDIDLGFRQPCVPDRQPQQCFRAGFGTGSDQLDCRAGRSFAATAEHLDAFGELRQRHPGSLVPAVGKTGARTSASPTATRSCSVSAVANWQNNDAGVDQGRSAAQRRRHQRILDEMSRHPVPSRRTCRGADADVNGFGTSCAWQREWPQPGRGHMAEECTVRKCQQQCSAPLRQFLLGVRRAPADPTRGRYERRGRAFRGRSPACGSDPGRSSAPGRP